MLSGMMLVAAVDKRYLPGGANTVTMLGFTGQKQLFQMKVKDFNKNSYAGIIACKNLIENYTVILMLFDMVMLMQNFQLNHRRNSFMINIPHNQRPVSQFALQTI